MQLNGHAFAPRSSQRSEAQLQLEVDPLRGSQWVLLADTQRLCYPVDQVAFSAPIGDMPIRSTLPDGRIFMTKPSAELEDWLKAQQSWNWHLNWLESNKLAWLASLLLCVLLTVAGYQYGLPYLSHKIARAVPTPWALQIGDKVLDTFDHYYQPSQLSVERQSYIQQRLDTQLAKLPAMSVSIQLEFRAAADHQVNAFALPGGIIVVLDNMVTLAENDQQLDAILLHELGHVYYQHMMTRLVRSSIISVAVAMMTGEASGVIDNLAGMGVFLLANRQSQADEAQADQFARHALLTLHGSADNFAKMLRRLKSQQTDIEIPNWLSSHPAIDKRIDAND